jgi:hypothetical protein
MASILSESWLEVLKACGATDALAGGQLSDLGTSQEFPFAPQYQNHFVPMS